MYAVVNTGGKQLKVAVGDTVSVEKLDAAPGSVIQLTALLINDDEKVIVGKEAAAIAITAEVVGHGKADKVVVFKFKKRKGYKRTKGHRQELTLVKVTDIGIVGKKSKKAEVAVEAEEKAQKAAPKPKAAPKAKAEAKPAADKESAATKVAAKPAATKAAAKPAAEKPKTAAKPKAAAKPAAAKAPAAKKPAAKKPAAKKTEKPAE